MQKLHDVGRQRSAGSREYVSMLNAYHLTHGCKHLAVVETVLCGKPCRNLAAEAHIIKVATGSHCKGTLHEQLLQRIHA